MLQDRSDLSPIYSGILIRTLFNTIFARYGSGELVELNQQRTMEFINGKPSTPIADKYQFNEIVRSIGYSAPRQFLVNPGNKGSIEEQLEKINGEQVFIKPRKGDQGGKIKVVSKQEAAVILSKSKDESIVQELINTDSEYRYAILNENNQKIRLCFERVLPKVTGDGKSTLMQLIRHSDMPPETKAINILNSRKSLKIVPGQGETLKLSHVVNIPSGGYERYPDEKVMPNLDRFFTQFIGDLQARLGAQFLLISFDFGILDNSVLQGEYDFEKMKKSIVFFESQMPFGFEGYTLHIPGTTPLNKYSVAAQTEMRFLGEIIKARNEKT